MSATLGVFCGKATCQQPGGHKVCSRLDWAGRQSPWCWGSDQAAREVGDVRGQSYRLLAVLNAAEAEGGEPLD